ncbi:MAG: hypothetical protein U1G05_02625 [Kiritimatiellia bacterium]
MRELGRPFWLAGNGSSPEVMKAALASGAEGLQVGTLFAFSDESGVTPEIKRQVVELAVSGKAVVYTDPRISPTGFPFKVLELPGTMSDASSFDARPKRCDLGYLRAAYRKEDGTIGFRCASEPDREFLKKGGDAAEIPGRKCLCNALSGTIGMAQANKDGYTEAAVVTTGDQVKKLADFLPRHHPLQRPPGHRLPAGRRILNAISRAGYSARKLLAARAKGSSYVRWRSPCRS